MNQSMIGEAAADGVKIVVPPGQGSKKMLKRRNVNIGAGSEPVDPTVKLGWIAGLNGAVRTEGRINPRLQLGRCNRRMVFQVVRRVVRRAQRADVETLEYTVDAQFIARQQRIRALPDFR